MRVLTTISQFSRLLAVQAGGFDHFLLVPGVGAQGGSLEEVARYGLNTDCGLLVNSSRGIIYAGNDKNYDESARKEAIKMQQQMEDILLAAGILNQ